MGVKVVPFNAALTSASVPVKVIVASALPSPTLKLRPAVCASVRLPWVTLSSMRSAAVFASTSATWIALPFAVDSSSGVFSAVSWVPGSWFTGASLIALTASELPLWPLL